jgi:hypothetical protein
MPKNDKKLKIFRVTFELRGRPTTRYVLAPRLQDCPRVVKQFYSDQDDVRVTTVSRVTEEEGVLP